MRQFFLEAILPFHVYSRGVDKRIIYTDYAEYCRFVFLMWVCRIGRPKFHMEKKETIAAAEAILRGKKPDKSVYAEQHDPLVAVITWNLMPNHYHLLLVSLEKGGTSKYMGKIADAYTKYFNTRHERSGHLFQGPYQSIEVRQTRYFYTLLRYINLNHAELIEPEWKERHIRNGSKLKAFIDKHEWSAHRDYMGVRSSLLVDRKLAGGLYQAKFTEKGLEGYEDFIEYWRDGDVEIDTEETKKYFIEKDKKGA